MTPATERGFAKIGDHIVKRIPERRWGQPADFAGAAVYLARQASTTPATSW
jgi:NAD(P)-dependent dehydrogenase (short-subunit alcohol dehydrogenase family)